MKWELSRIYYAFEKLSNLNWDTSNDLKWGFTFFAKSKTTLNKIFDELVDYNYHIDKFEKREDLDLWMLHVTKIETLLPDKLHRRNLAFEQLANSFDESDYDGWSVEKTEN
ncbi:ribonuclease E inhibitor RraB [Limibacter armeniacum]|uniref:ribonuclease E inhibitor RraB n=1 Tax=Limibacter armeniacum TaxID=466084 RepID=UPI002FE55E38